MVGYKRVALRDIGALTFFDGQKTAARRTSPIPQLTCLGKACRSFRPDVVQCTNVGDDGAGGVQWKCETDLPVGYRLGKVQVNCEGWARAGDTDVLQGSCGLEYNLVKVDRGLEYGESSRQVTPSRGGWGILDMAFVILCILVLLYVFYPWIRAALRLVLPANWVPPPLNGNGDDRPHPGGGGGGGGPGGGGRWGWPYSSSGNSGRPSPPPPYTKTPDSGWQPGFWTGTALGAAGAWFANSFRRPVAPRPTGRQWGWMRQNDAMYDWEMPEVATGVGSARSPVRSFRVGEAGGSRDEGTTMRRATGFGGTTTR